MRRSPALTPLSHDHQHALDVALRLRRAEAGTAAAAVAHFLALFEREDHDAIRGAADTFQAGEPDLDAVRALGGRLNDDVRFEERQLFEILERRLPEERLIRLGDLLSR
jgi:hypothetical protein